MNGRSRRIRALAVALLLLAPLLVIAARAGATDIAVRPMTPPDIGIADLPQGPVFVTKNGMTIYKQLPDIGGWGHAKKQADVIGSCVYQCPEDYPPLKAPADAAPVGDFTIVTSATGIRQWAYKGVPLQTFAYDRNPGDTLGEDTFAFNGPRVPTGEAAWVESEIPPAKPPEPPPATTNIPPGMTVQAGMGGNRYFANAAGLTLYTHDGDTAESNCANCGDEWAPLPAGAMARGLGDWSVIAREDGTRRWAYKGKPVYTYAKDDKPGEPTTEIGGKWRPVVEYQAPLPAEVSIRQTETGAVFAEKATGRTLYYEGFAHRPYQYLGFNHDPYLYGTVNCYNECAKTYPPLLAPVDAKPMGDWWVITRVDGSKQWGYRGVPVYTYAEDEPGRHLASYKDHVWTEAMANNR
jgi:predicted lipoprotein with Yx(FWY)xxD motif